MTVTRAAIAALSVLAVLAVLAAPAGADTASQDNRTRVTRAAETLVRAGIPGVVVSVRDGRREFTIARGLGDVRRHVPMRPGDRFRIGSVTKTYVATVVMQHVDAGTVTLDDTVERWLPGLLPNGPEVTIRDLLDHRSGIADYEEAATPSIVRHPHRTRTAAEMIRIGVDQGSQFGPDTRFSYSSTNYLILGKIVESATGRSLRRALADGVFAPLHARQTSIDVGTHIGGRHAHGYMQLGKRLVDTTRWTPSWGGAAGAMTSTAQEVMGFERALLSGRLTTAGSLAAMRQTRRSFFRGEGYGLGLMSTSTFLLTPKYHISCGKAWGHTGGIPGYRSYAYSTRNGQRQFVVLINRDPRTAASVTALTRVMEAAYCGR